MSAASVTARGRRAAEALFTDEFTAYAPTTRAAQDESTGVENPVYVEQGTVWGKVQGPSTQASDTTTRTITEGGVERDVMLGALHLPVCETPAVGWEYVCTYAGPTTPSAMVGKRFRVVNVPLKSFQTAYRLDVIETDEPVVYVENVIL